MVTRKRCAFCQSENREEFESLLENGEVSCEDLDSSNSWRSGTASKHQRNHMGEFVMSSNPKCKFCTDSYRKEIELQLSNGEASSEEIADMLGITKVQVQRHMKNHLQPLVQQSAATLIAQKEINEIEMISVNIQKLDSKLEQVFQNDELDPKMIDALTKLAREIRESLRFSLEAKGKLIHRRQDTVIVAQMQIVQEVLAQNNPEIWLEIKRKMTERLQ